MVRGEKAAVRGAVGGDAEGDGGGGVVFPFSSLVLGLLEISCARICLLLSLDGVRFHFLHNEVCESLLLTLCNNSVTSNRVSRDDQRHLPSCVCLLHARSPHPPFIATPLLSPKHNSYSDPASP